MTTGERILESIELGFCEGTSDKVYNIQLVEYNDPIGFGVTKLYRVDFQYGRRGNTLNTGTKIQGADINTATKVYAKLSDEKTGKGYKVMAGASQPVTASPKAAQPFEVHKVGTTVGVASSMPFSMPLRKLVFDDDVPVIPQLCNPIEEGEIEKLLKDD